MLFRKMVFGLLTVGFGLAALAFGLLFIICLSLLLLWHGLSTSVIMFGVLTVACLVLAYKTLKRALARERGRQTFASGDKQSFANRR